MVTTGLFKSFDTVKEIVDNATEEFECPVDEEKAKSLEWYCEMIDSLVMEYDGTRMSVGVDRDSHDITVTVTLKSWVDVHSVLHDLNQLVTYVKSFAFHGTEDGDNVIAEFTFPGVWGQQ